LLQGEFSGGASEVKEFGTRLDPLEFTDIEKYGNEFQFSQQLARESISLSCDFKIRKKSFFKRRWLL
jgi:hypothetical protein